MVRDLILTLSALTLVAAPAMAQAPSGLMPISAVAQRTEPGRYWVFFAWNRADLPADGRKVVEEAAQSFLRTGSARVSLVGGADRTGPAAYNKKLSARRAEAVRAELMRHGVPAGAITVRPEGEDALLVNTGPGVREPLNRYVAIDFPDREVPVSAAPAAEAMAPAPLEQPVVEPWQLTIAPYLWAIALHGDVGVGKSSANVDASFKDVLDNLNGALMLSLELRKGRFGLLSDSIFAQLEDDGASERDRVKVDATANMFIQNLAGTYRLGTWQLGNLGSAGPATLTVDPYAGIRYTYLDAELDGKLDLFDLGIDARRTASQREHWVDPIVGLRTTWGLGEHWSVVAAGDVGGISTSDQHSAEAWGLVGYRFSLFGENNANVFAGYRMLYQKYQNGSGRSEFDWDMTMHGPVAGLKITF